MRAKLVTASLLVAAALANLPIVYAIIGRDRPEPALTLAFGFASMGLAWAAGFVIEGRRRWFALLASGVGAAEALLAFAPVEGDGVRGYMIAAGALSAAALVLLATWKPLRAQPA